MNLEHTIAAGLQKAIQTENDGHHFYRMAADHIQDEKGREVFETLAQEELAHLRFLTAQYRSFLETGRADDKARLGPRADLSGQSPIFSEAILGRMAEAHFEMSALSIGIQLELNAERYYREQASAASDSKVRAFYLELADWESGHYHALLRQQEGIKEAYWQAGGFAPF